MAEVVIQSGTPERIAFELMQIIRSAETTAGKKFDRASILELYQECLRTAKGADANMNMKVTFVDPKGADEAW